MILPLPRIAIVGGGFSGAVVAVRLGQRASTSCTITIYEPRPLLGGGVAYSTADPAHRVNVPASKMTVFSEDETHFDRWVRRSDLLDPAAEVAGGYLYPSRLSFGRYLAELVATAPRPIVHVPAQVTGIAAEATGYRIALADGTHEAADLVVLAVSHPPPIVPPQVQAALGADPAMIADPWRPGALDVIAPDEQVLIMGTGLTMADVLATLARRGHHVPIIAFSRHGLVSRGHPKAPHPALERFGAAEPPTTALRLLRAVRQRLAEARALGLPWQAVFDDLRINGRRLWRALPPAERRRMLRHLRAHWDSHRYRLAPQVEAVLERKQADGTLTIHAASLVEIAREGDRLHATLRPRHASADATIALTIDRLVVTTGPGHAGVLGGNPALASLHHAGSIQPDPVGLGILVDETSHAIAADGNANPTLLIAGPLARDSFGELMGLPQVSIHAALVADQVVRWLKLHTRDS